MVLLGYGRGREGGFGDERFWKLWGGESGWCVTWESQLGFLGPGAVI